jgi:replicative DNA helicase
MKDRVPPNSLEAEQAVIGSMLVDRRMVQAVLGVVQPTDFYAFVHEELYGAIRTLYERNEPIDKIMLADYLRAKPSRRRTSSAANETQLDDVGGLAYITSLMDAVPTAASAEYYAELVAEKAALRELISFGSVVAKLGFEGEEDVEATLSEARRLFDRATDRTTKRGGGQTVFDGMAENLELLRNVSRGAVSSRAQVTPYESLNEIIGPVMPGGMVLWAAPPKMGKSGIAIACAEWNSRYGISPLFSPEMMTPEVMQRYTAMHGRVSVRKQREGNLSEFDLARIEAARQRFANKPIPVFDRRSVRSIADIRRELRLLEKQGPIGSYFVDGVHRLDDVKPSRGERGVSIDQLFNRMYQALLDLNAEFDCTCHATVHINRTGAQKERPTVNDIRDGGNPEGLMHAIVMPFRPHPTGKPEEQLIGEMIAAAVRDGSSGVAKDFEFIGARSLWIDTKGHDGRPWFDPIRTAAEREPEREVFDYYGQAS